ncbi:MAG: lamin tail domain-containing protein [Acidobacteria bacterium]|nr:lamin tail domain-containing protein [Acidobacteriota bacterium]
MRHHARFCALAFVVFAFSASADFNRVLAQTPTPTPVQPGQVVISELRLRGPAGAEDEFVEVYNNTDLPIVVQASDQTAGWSVWVSNGQITGPLSRRRPPPPPRRV